MLRITSSKLPIYYIFFFFFLICGLMCLVTSFIGHVEIQTCICILTCSVLLTTERKLLSYFSVQYSTAKWFGIWINILKFYLFIYVCWFKRTRINIFSIAKNWNPLNIYGPKWDIKEQCLQNQCGCPFNALGKRSCFTLKIQRSKSNVLCIIEEFASPLEGSLLLDNSNNKKWYRFFYHH